MSSAPFADALLRWYEKNHRDLPWRRVSDPYRIWVSEIMLQQTRVETVIPYYERFLEELPDLAAMAECSEEILLKLWEGLGYYSRVRNMQKTARLLQAECGGRFPETAKALESLPGIGVYTSAAIASIAFGEPVPAVDGNVLRVWARLCEDETDVKTPAARSRAQRFLLPFMPKERPGLFNQAMMELGACLCLPHVLPRCSECPLALFCQSNRHQTTDRYPVRSRQKERRVEERTVLLVRSGDRILIRRRPAKGLLAGLWELPSLEGFVTEREALAAARSWGADPMQIETLPEARHLFTHVEWRMKGFHIRAAAEPEPPLDSEKTWRVVPLSELRSAYAVPSAFSAFMKLE